MSNPASFDRSDLERMDRKQLQAIASHLGEKGTSRARKAEIVDAIIGHVDTSGPVAVMEAVAAASTATAAKSVAASTEEASEAPVVEASSNSSRGAESGESKKQQPQPPRTDDDGEGSSDASQIADDSAADGREDQGNQRQRQRDRNGNRRDEQAESGNRRRRRRGRDRGDDDSLPNEPIPVQGLLDLRDEGFGFLRVNGPLPSRDDVYVSVKQSRQLRLRRGDVVTGEARPANRNEKNPAMVRILTVNDIDPDRARNRQRFDELTAIPPHEHLRLEGGSDGPGRTGRAIDIIAPIAKGQRGLVGGTGRSGGTRVLTDIAAALNESQPDLPVFVIMIGARPEDVTLTERALTGSEVVGVTFDRPVDEQIHLAELAVERAKRMVERGEDVVLLVDGLTRLTKLYNVAEPGTGHVIDGLLDSASLIPVRRLLGAGRCLEEGGSLTLLATASVGTGSRIDDLIYGELADTVNLEIRLDATLASRGAHPALDVANSDAAHEAVVVGDDVATRQAAFRAGLLDKADDSVSAGARLLALIDGTSDNDALLASS